MKPGTSYAELTTLKPLLDQGAGEDVGGDASYVPAMGPAYVMEVHPRQVDLVEMHSSVDFVSCMGIWSTFPFSGDRYDNPYGRSIWDHLRSQQANQTSDSALDRHKQRGRDTIGEPTSDSSIATDYKNLKILSMRKGFDINREPNFYFHSPRGQGAWIFVLDSGFSIDSWPEEFSTANRKVETYFVPQEKCLTALDPDSLARGWDYADVGYFDDDISVPGAGHGTAVAAAAGGATRGVAPNANLYLVKMSSGYKNPFYPAQGSAVQCPGISRDAFIDAMRHLYDLFTTQADIYPPSNSVINICFEFLTDGNRHPWELTATEAQWNAVWDEWMVKMDNLGVTVVIAAGNSGLNYDANNPDWNKTPQGFLKDRLPLKFITEDKPFIMVGGVYPDGSLYEITTPNSPDIGVIASVYAQATELQTLAMNGQVIDGDEGTSFAAPAVAGLVANFLTYPWPERRTNPFDPSDPSRGSVGTRMKAAIKDYSYQRLPDANLLDGAFAKWGWASWELGFDVPNRVNTAYNMAWGP